MPELDRRIIVRVVVHGRNHFGEAVVLSTTDYPQWSRRRDAGSEDIEEEGGARVQHRVEHEIRYNRALALGGPIGVSVLDDGILYNTETIAEGDERRRFVTITGVATT